MGANNHRQAEHLRGSFAFRHRHPNFPSRALPPNGRKKGDYENYETGRYVTVTGQHIPGTPLTVETRRDELLCVHREQWPETPKPESEHSNGKSGTNGKNTARKTPRKASTGGSRSKPSNRTDDNILALCGKAKNADKFHHLMDGDISLHDGDDSAADLALLCILAFYTKDAAQLESLFGRSKLADRDKWKDRTDYRKRSIDAALRLTTEQYSPPGRKFNFRANGRQYGQHDSATGEQQADKTGSQPGREDQDKQDIPNQPESFNLGPLNLIPGPARRTPSKVNVPVKVAKGDEIVLEFPLTSASSSWKNPTRQLLQLIAEDAKEGEPTKEADVERVFMKIIADASNRADSPPAREGPTVAEIVRTKSAAYGATGLPHEQGCMVRGKTG